MRVAIYVRVSSRMQVQGESLDDQLAACRLYITQQGWTEVVVYVEPGRSAFTENLDKRMAFQQLRADAQAHRFDVVLVYKLNRFARKVIVQYQIAAELERSRVQIASATQPIDRRTVGGRITFGVLAVLAEAQSDELSAVMRDKWQAEARKGRHVGPVPCGYDRGPDGHLVPNADADAVRTAFVLYRQADQSYRTVAMELNARGSTNRGRPFTTAGVEELLKNPVYIGTVRCVGFVYPDAHPPLIAHDIWHDVQNRIAKRGARRVSVRPVRDETALLVDLATCAHCGQKMWHQGRSGRSSYYRCRSVVNGGVCGAAMARADDTELITLATLATLTLPGAWLRSAVDDVRALARPAQPSNAAAIEQRLKRLARLYQDGLKTDAEYETELAELRAQAALVPPVVTVDTTVLIDQALRLLADLPTVLAEAPPREQRALVVQCIEQVYLKRRDVVLIRPSGIVAPFLAAAYARLDEGDWRAKCVEWAGRASHLHHTSFYHIFAAARRPLLHVA